MKQSKKKKKTNTWKIKQHREQFFKKSKTLGYRSRSAFKLIELNKKYKFIKKNTKLLDIGAYPGGWAQIASKIITTGKILSVDIKKMDELKNVSFLQCDFFEENTVSHLKNLNIEAWLMVLHAGILCSLMGHMSMFYLYKFYPVGTVLPFYALFPVFGIILSFFIFSEIPTLIMVIGGIIVITSVFLLQKAT